MKVGTDGVLLGAWVQVSTAQRVLDIGTGTGLIALMVAQRNKNCEVLGIDLDGDAAEQASQNAAESPFQERVRVKEADVRTFSEETGFDVIVSNPPYFNGTYVADEHKREVARHQTGLRLNDLISKAWELGKVKHDFALILPTEVAREAQPLFREQGYFLRRECHVRPTPSKNSKRLLQQWSSEPVNVIASDELVIEVARHKYTESYRGLCAEFYLNF